MESLEYYKVGDKINFRIKSKTEITKILETIGNKDLLLTACKNFSSDFLFKIKNIVENDNFDLETLNANLEQIFNISTTGRRTQQSFYALWHFLSRIPLEVIKENKNLIREDLKNLFLSMNNVDTKDSFSMSIDSFWKKYN